MFDTVARVQVALSNYFTFTHFLRILAQSSDKKIKANGVEWHRGRVVDFGPRGPVFNPQPGQFSLWP